MPASQKEESPKELRRRQRQGLSRTQLLDAAERAFGRKGFHATTLQEVADQAEFSVPSVYSFFESKDDLLQQVLHRRSSEMYDGMYKILTDDGMPRAQLHELIDYSVEFLRNHRDFAMIILMHSSPSQFSEEQEVISQFRLGTSYDKGVELQAQLFKRGQELGQFRAGDPNVLAQFFTSLCITYEALDPKIVLNEPPHHDHFPLAEFHKMIDGAFAP